jgi:hypothetical protein
MVFFGECDGRPRRNQCEASRYHFNCRKDFFACNRAESLLSGRAMDVLQIAGR